MNNNVPFATRLSHRSLIRIAGPDRAAFLQGLVSNDVSKANAQQSIYAALLTPQGKFLHDLFIFADADSFLIDCEAARAEDLLRRLDAYKLRSKVTFENLAGAFDILAVWGAPHLGPADPRLPELGARFFVKKASTILDVTLTDAAAYDEHRIKLGVADGSRDMEVEKSTLAEGNFDFLNGIDWKKGCYVGQELTARMHYRGLAKKRLFPVRIEGLVPPPGTGLGEDGALRSSRAFRGLALLRIEAVQQAIDQEHPLTYGKTTLWPSIPGWMKIDAPPANR
jgi:folate-binding protein YgfZ